MTRPSLLLLSFSPISRDPRVMRQLRLFANHYRVVTCGYGPAPAESAAHIEIPVDLKPWRASYKTTALMQELRLHRKLYFGAPRVRYVLDVARKLGGVDIVLANDVFAVPLAVALSPRLGVHADLHEFSPAQGHGRTWRRRIGSFLEWACRTYLPQVESVTTTSSGFADQYSAAFGVHCDIVPNATRHRPDLSPTPTGSTVRMIHAGAAGPARRVEVMIQAVTELNRRRSGRYELDLYLVPGDVRYIEQLRTQAGDAAVTGVRLREPVAFDQLVPTMHGYDVGVHVLPPVNFNHLWALPNKIFEFVQARLALVVSPNPSIRPLVERHGVGAVAAGYEVADLVATLDSLTTEDIDRYKAASHAAAEELSAENLSAPWVDGIAAIAAKGSR